MSIDWNKAGEAAVLIIPTALASAYIGARVKSHLDRAKPKASITGFRIGKGSDLVVSKVRIPPDLSLRLRNNPWAPPLFGEVNTAKLLSNIQKLKQALAEAGAATTFLQGKLSELSRVASGPDNAKIAFLNEITEPEHRIIDAAFTGALVRQDLRLPLPPDEELTKSPKVVEFFERTEADGGYWINLQNAWYGLRYRDKRDNVYLLPAAKAMAYFHEPSLRELLEHCVRDLVSLAATGASVLAEIEQLTTQSVPLIVEVRITNSGRSSVLFTSWAILEVVHPNDATQDIAIELVRSMSYWKPDDPVQAAKQQALLVELPEIPMEQDTYFVVEAGKSVKMVYRSCQPVEHLKSVYPNLLNIMGLELFRSQVHLKRADAGGGKQSWLHSDWGNFGTKSDQFPHEEKPLALTAVGMSKKWLLVKLRKWLTA